jgi:hypothetical protein
MLRKTMIVLATAAALTGGLTADAFARGGGGGGGHGGGFVGRAHMGGGFGGGGGSRILRALPRPVHPRPVGVAKPSQVGIVGAIKPAYSIKVRSQLGGSHLA